MYSNRENKNIITKNCFHVIVYLTVQQIRSATYGEVQLALRLQTSTTNLALNVVFYLSFHIFLYELLKYQNAINPNSSQSSVTFMFAWLEWVPL